MALHKGREYRFVTRDQRLEHGFMLQYRSVPPVGIQVCKRARLFDPRVQHLPHLDQNIVLRKLEKRAVNGTVVPDIRRKIAPVIEDEHLVVKNAQLADLLIRRSLAGEPGSESLYVSDGLIKIFDSFDVDLGHDGAFVGRQLDQSFTGQGPDRFTKRRPRNS